MNLTIYTRLFLYCLVIELLLYIGVALGTINAYRYKILSKDSLALVSFYHSTNGENWTNNTNWLSSQPLSTWYGVTVDSNRVIYLDLIENNLTGTLPPEIGDLTELDSLHLAYNDITGDFEGI